MSRLTLVPVALVAVTVAGAGVLAFSSPAGAQAPDQSSPPDGIEVGPPLTPTTTTPDPVEVPGGEEAGDPGFFDIPGRVKKAVNDWFRDLVTSALGSTLDLLGRTLLSTPLVTGPGRVRDLWGTTAGIANAVMVLFAVVGGAVAMGYETLQTRYAVKEILPRLVVAVIAANASLALAGQAITLANATSRAFLGQSLDAEAVSEGVRGLVVRAVASGGIFLILIGLVVAVLALALLLVYVVRVAMVVLLVAAAPIALACHALPQTEGTARLWWRAFSALLLVQVAQSLVLITAVRVFFAPDGPATLGFSATGSLVDLLVVIALFYVLLKIPGWARAAVFSNRAGSTTVRVVKHEVVRKAAVAAKAAAA